MFGDKTDWQREKMKAKAELDLGKLVKPYFIGKNTGPACKTAASRSPSAPAVVSHGFRLQRLDGARDLQAEVSSACKEALAHQNTNTLTEGSALSQKPQDQKCWAVSVFFFFSFFLIFLLFSFSYFYSFLFFFFFFSFGVSVQEDTAGSPRRRWWVRRAHHRG